MSPPITHARGDGASGEVIVLGRRAPRASGDHLSRETRGLSTARSVLKVLSLMAQHPDGISAREVAQELGKSVSTAYYLLTSLLEEGFADHQPGGGYRLRAGAGLGVVTSRPSPDDALTQAVDDLFARTHRRSYLGRVATGMIVLTTESGRQGIPRVPGLGARIGRNAHALAMGKVVLSLLPERGRRRYTEGGLSRYTPHTITSPEALLSELHDVRRDGFAIDRGEFHSEFCCVAAPVFCDRGRFRAVLGLSTSSRTFEADARDLAGAVRDVAAAVSGKPARRRPEDPQPTRLHTSRAA
jgi:acetyl-CoA synthetase